MAVIPGMAEFEKLEHKTLKTSPLDLTYSYYLSPDFNNRRDHSTPTLLFVHGFPDDAQMWSGVVPQMLSLPYRFIMVDILGLGESTKSTKTSDYSWRQQANCLAQILDAEGVQDNVIPIAHDWGSSVAQRFYLHHRARCAGLVLLSVAYLPPQDQLLSLQEINAIVTKYFGYTRFEYWNFMTSPDGAALIDANIDRMYEAMHGFYPSPDPEDAGRDIWMREIWCVPNAMRDYLSRSGKYKDYTVPLKPYAQNPALKQRFMDRMARHGFSGPVNYYRITMLEDEKDLCGSPNDEAKRIDVPVLYIGATDDWVCRTDQMGAPRDQGFVPDLEERTVEAGHWLLYEKPDEVAEILSEWLQRRFPAKQ